MKLNRLRILSSLLRQFLRVSTIVFQMGPNCPHLMNSFESVGKFNQPELNHMFQIPQSNQWKTKVISSVKKTHFFFVFPSSSD